VPAEISAERVFDYGRQYLKSVGQEGQPLAANECQFCHVEPAKTAVLQEIKDRGYFIKEMEGCR
jgi:hypothetical protein